MRMLLIWFSVKISLTLNSFNLQSTFQDFLSVSLTFEQVKTRLNGLGEFCCDSEVPSCLLCHLEWNSSWFFEHRPVRTPQHSEWLVLSPWPISFPLCTSFSLWGCYFSVDLRMSEVAVGSTFPGNGFTKAYVMSGSPINNPSYKDGCYQFVFVFAADGCMKAVVYTVSLLDVGERSFWRLLEVLSSSRRHLTPDKFSVLCRFVFLLC